MMCRLSRFVIHIATVLVVATGAACSDGGIAPRVGIVAPVDGAVLDRGTVRVELAATGVEIAAAADERPGTAHHHIFIDRDITPLADTIPAGVSGIVHLGRGQTTFDILELPAGEHRVIAVLADWAHVPLSPPVTDTVHFTIRP